MNERISTEERIHDLENTVRNQTDVIRDLRLELSESIKVRCQLEQQISNLMTLLGACKIGVLNG